MLTLRDVCSETGLVYTSVLARIHAGEIPSSLAADGRTHLVSRADLDKWLTDRRIHRVSAVDRPRERDRHILRTVLDQPGWDEQRIADALELRVSTVRSWISAGTPRMHLSPLRRLIADQTEERDNTPQA